MVALFLALAPAFPIVSRTPMLVTNDFLAGRGREVPGGVLEADAGGLRGDDEADVAVVLELLPLGPGPVLPLDDDEDAAVGRWVVIRALWRFRAGFVGGVVALLQW